ncbi:MAG: translation initiation factor IF-1 [Candidatus Vogelbacteria bacterium CG10_big_fil_rev_8_21_14_0_10_51_16]|uniref:Translation initiation factor IF-1 n=1 Tax=Candidatus Vogelbacteria bacterium CG10_big_fil_rev_8_21_14_0_10_51_16 TaxID=1975045 RepID=A0A2H0RE91_9BACT|nr:MAG: translation initiation factor IF-1 [Candidatus Vogelbacteria bacterium CG10_big_fil_rev_8_21_14_0_10_51_16]
MSDSTTSENSTKGKEVVGQVTETLPNTMYRVEFDGRSMPCPLAGKMRLHRIRVMIGDKVLVQLDAYGERGRITRRL